MLCSSASSAQSPALTILAAKGKPLLQNGKKAGWQNITTGMKIYAGGTLKLASSDYCALTSSAGGTLELNEGGTYGFDDLVHRMAMKKQSIAKRVVDYLSDKLVNTGDSKNMKSLGAVVRATRNHVATACPNTTALLQQTYQIAWYNSEGKPQYIVHILNDEGKTVLMKSTSDSCMSLDFTDLQFRFNTDYRWFIQRLGKNQSLSDTIRFRCLDERASKAILDTVKNMTAVPDFSSSALNNMAVGIFLESHQCNYEAGSYYEKAVNLSGGASGFLEHCLRFLIRTGQDMKALEIYNKYAR
jgi:hypothetical protein